MGGNAAAPWQVQQGSAGDSPAAAVDQKVPSNEPQNIVDENDPRLVSETVEMNLEGDAYAQPAPPPDKTWRAKLKLEGIKKEGSTEVKDYHATQTKGQTPVPYFETRISAQILDPAGRFDGVTVYPEYGGGVGTLLNRENTSKASTILARLKRPNGEAWAKPGQRMTQLEWIQLLVQALKTDPEIGIETQWQVSCQACGEEATAKRKAGHTDVKYPSTLKGMHRFPAEKDPGKLKLGLRYDPEVACQANPAHGFSRARALLVGFLHLNELKDEAKK